MLLVCNWYGGGAFEVELQKVLPPLNTGTLINLTHGKMRLVHASLLRIGRL